MLQGDSWGPLISSNLIDGFSRECLTNNQHLHTYRGEVEIAPLVMLDDMLTISNCGYQTNQMEAFLNSQASFRNVR